jgi:hypothetical protein
MFGKKNRRTLPMRRILPGIAVLLLAPALLLARTPVTQDQDPRANGTFVTPIPDAPFTAVDKVEHTRIAPDGTTVHLQTTREIARDSRGRIFKVARMLRPVAENGTPAIIVIELYDPQTKTYTLIYPRSRTFWKGDLDRTPSLLAQEYFYGRHMHNGLPVYQYSREQDLGIRTMDDLSAHGIRETQTVVNEKGKTVDVTDEYWYSDDLRMSLLAKCNLPDEANLTVTVIQITRTEPDPNLFEIPSGYKQLDRPEE